MIYPHPAQPDQYPAHDQSGEWPTAVIQMPQPPKKKGIPVLVWVLIGVSVMFIMCLGAMSLATKSPEARTSVITTEPEAEGAALVKPSPAAPAKKAPVAVKTKAPAVPVYKMGKTIRAGDFAYVIHSKKCGIARVGDQFLNKKAQGSYCRLDLSVKNMTRAPHYFTADGTVSATDTQDRRFSADGEAGVYGNKGGAGFLDEINPGNQVRAFVFFDLPKGAKLATVTFNAGTFTTAQDATVPF